MHIARKFAPALSVLILLFLALSFTWVRPPSTTSDQGRGVASQRSLPGRVTSEAASHGTAVATPDEPLPQPGSTPSRIDLPAATPRRASGEETSSMEAVRGHGGALVNASDDAAAPRCAWLVRDLSDMRFHSFHPHEVLVKFRAEVNEAGRGASLRAVSSVQDRQLGEGESEEANRWRLVDLQQAEKVEDALAALSSDGQVEYAEPNWRLSASLLPNDPLFSRQWDMYNTGQTGGTYRDDIHMPEAWNLSTGTNVIVGEIDTGIDYNHSDLAANCVQGYNFVAGTTDPMDDNGHGTHVAGTIGAIGNNGGFIAGVCWHVRLMPLKFLDASGSGYDSDAVLAIRYATSHGARVTNNSWGGGGYSQAEYDAINEANSAGVLFVVAAGNDGTNNDVTPEYPANINLPNVIPVAATDKNDQLATWSCYGATTVALAAPGVSIFSTWPGNSTNTLSGTSMATPHVTGACALLFSYNPAKSAAQVKSAILSGTDARSNLSGKCITGGRLNVYKALLQLGSGGGGGGSTTHTISGTVTLNGSGLQGVSMSLSGAASASTTTASNGTYSFAALADGSYTVAPSLNGYTFSPSSLSVTLAGADSTSNNFAAAQVQNTPPAMQSPAPGSTLSSSTVTFTWSAGTGVTQYWLTGGTYQGGQDVFSQNAGSALTLTESGIPADGATLYVRLWYYVSGQWKFVDYTYTDPSSGGGGGVLPAFTSPTPGSTLTGSSATFTWSAGTGVYDYWLSVGTSLGGSNLYSQDQGLNLSATVGGLPTNGSTVYVRLWYLLASGWQTLDAQYTAVTVVNNSAPTITSPAPGSTLPGSTVTFRWSAGTGVYDYWVYVGSVQGGTRYLNRNMGTSTSVTVYGLPLDRSAVWVRLWYYTATGWHYRDFQFTAY